VCSLFSVFLFLIFTNLLERCLSGHTRKRWRACLHVTSRLYEIDIDANCQWNKYGFEISWLWHENTVSYFPTINLCIVVLNWVTFILHVYSSFIILLECCFSWHTSWKRSCVCLHMTSQFYEIDIGCIVVNEIDVILKLLTLDTEIQYFIS